MRTPSTARPAGRSWQAHLSAQLPDVVLGEARLRQWRTDAKRLDGPVAGPEIIQVVAVGAEDHVFDAPFLRDIQKPVARRDLQ